MFAVQCPPAVAVENAEIIGALDVKYGETLAYKCQAGHTITGIVAAAAAFTVPCLASDQLAPAQACCPVSCGLPPVRAGMDVVGSGTTETTFGQEVQ